MLTGKALNALQLNHQHVFNKKIRKILPNDMPLIRDRKRNFR